MIDIIKTSIVYMIKIKYMRLPQPVEKLVDNLKHTLECKFFARIRPRARTSSRLYVACPLNCPRAGPLTIFVSNRFDLYERLIQNG